LRGLSSVGLAVVLTCYWFPKQPDLGWLFIWMLALLIVFVVLLVGSMFLFHPDVDLVPPHGAIRLDI
jgi:hypothetical protein